MPIATITINRFDDMADWTQTDIAGLQESVLGALDRHFVTYLWAAEAQREYARVRAQIEAGTSLTLFGAVETMRAGWRLVPGLSRGPHSSATRRRGSHRSAFQSGLRASDFSKTNKERKRSWRANPT